MRSLGLGVGCAVALAIVLVAASCGGPSEGTQSGASGNAGAMTPDEAKAELRKMEIFFSQKSFFQCAVRRNLPALKLFMAGGMDVNVKGEFGEPALSNVMAPSQVEVAQFLLDHGADVNVGLDEGNAPLWYAVQSSNMEMIRVLLAKGAVPDVVSKGSTSEGKTPLMVAVYYENVEMVKTLLAHQARVDLSDKQGNTALSIAKGKGNAEIVGLLQEASAVH